MLCKFTTAINAISSAHAYKELKKSIPWSIDAISADKARLQSTEKPIPCNTVIKEYKSDFRKFAQKRPLHMIIFLTVSVLPNIFLTRLVKCL